MFKAELEILIKDFGISILIRFEQFANAYSSIYDTDSGMTMFIKLVLLNAYSPILVTVFGKFIYDNSIHPSKAWLLIEIIDFGNITLLNTVLSLNAASSIVLI